MEQIIINTSLERNKRQYPSIRSNLCHLWMEEKCAKPRHLRAQNQLKHNDNSPPWFWMNVTWMVSRVFKSSRGYVHNVEQTPAVAPATVDAGIIRCEGSPGFGASKVFTVSYAKSWTPKGKPPTTTSHKNFHQHWNPNKTCILEKVGTPCEKNCSLPQLLY